MNETGINKSKTVRSGSYINPQIMAKIFLVILVVIAHFFTYANEIQEKYLPSLFYLDLLLAAILLFFTLNKRVVLFEPIVLFSAYYITVYLSGFFLILFDFDKNFYIEHTIFRNDISVLVADACMYYLFGYLCMLFGYLLIKKNNYKIEVVLNSKREIPDVVVNIFVLTFLLIGIANFAYNVWMHAAGNIFQYMANISMRDYEFEDSGTTLGYMFSEVAMYIWFFKLAREKTFYNKWFILFFLLSLVLKSSAGRVFAITVYVVGFIGIYYYIEMGSKKIISNLKYYLMAIFLMAAGIAIYLFRIISSLAFNDALTNDVGGQFQELVGDLGHIALNLGYIPNTAIFMKIIDSWDTDIGYLYGESLISWILNCLPSFIKPIGYQPSIMVAKTWYSDYPTGSLPPTGIGEMYANFGMLGPFVGMFIFGCLAAGMYNLMVRSKSYWVIMVCVLISYGFVMLYPKGEFDNLSLLTVLPIALSVLAMKFISNSISNLKYSNSEV